MLRALKNRNAQAVMGEYVVVIFLVMAVLTGMTVYFKRAVQARIYDARNYMIGEVRVRTAGLFNGNLYKEYEPYYANVASTLYRTMDDRTTLMSSGPAASSGIFRKVYNEETAARSNSLTLPPWQYNRTTPRF